MKSATLFGIAVLLLSTGAAHATSDWLDRCGKHLIHTYGHHGYMFFLMPKGAFELKMMRRGANCRRDCFGLMMTATCTFGVANANAKPGNE